MVVFDRLDGPGFLLILALLTAATGAHAAMPPYAPADASMAGTVITLTGHDLSVGQLVQIARHGARVRLSEEAVQQEADDYGLLLEAGAEGVPVYMLNRGGGLGRANVTLEGDPLTAPNKSALERRELAAFERGDAEGDGPEIAEEEIVRAVMAVRANGMVLETPSPQLSRMLLDLLNDRITPVVQSRGSVGESDLYILANIGAAMVGRGEVYYRGTRMPAARALHRAGLAPLRPFGLDSSTLANSNGYATALAALLVADARQALDWSDLTDAIDLDGMNGSITPLTAPVQMKRPDRWLNWDAGRVLDLLKGGYLFDADPHRILADADSLRASSIRQGAAWRAWAALRDSVSMQMNSSDHNPVVSVGLSPSDSWELASPQMMQFYVKGGTHSNGRHGYVVSSANWDPYPLANDIEAFSNALANVAVVVTQRIFRFNNPFFTVLKAGDPGTPANGTLTMGLWQEMQTLIPPLTAEGVSTDSQANGDIEAQAPLKARRSRQAVDLMLHLLAQDLLTGSYWMDLRRGEDPSRRFGDAPERAVAAFRQAVKPVSSREDGSRAVMPAAYAFVRDTPMSTFYPAAAGEPGGPVEITRAR